MGTAFKNFLEANNIQFDYDLEGEIERFYFPQFWDKLVVVEDDHFIGFVDGDGLNYYEYDEVTEIILDYAAELAE